MKVTVYGGTNNAAYTKREQSECAKLGAWLGKHRAHVLTGACKGFPYFVGKAAIAAGSRVTGYTPAVDIKEHTDTYGFLTDGVTDLVFCDRRYGSMSENFMRRSFDMTPFSDVVIALGGSWGTFSELIMSFMLRRTIILVDEFEGAVRAFEEAYEFFGKREINPMVHNGAKIIRVKTVDEAIQEMAKLNID